MKLEYFQYFIEIARTGSIAKAAAKLNRNRTTVSMAISALEDSLNTVLFIRSGNSLYLSPAGEKILDDAIRLVRLVDNIWYSAGSDHTQQPAILRLGRDDVFPESFWRRILRKIRFKYPGVTLAMNYASSGVLIEQVRKGEIDMACCMPENFDQTPHGMNATVVEKVALRLMASDNHPLSQMIKVDNNDLNEVPQIAYLGEGQEEMFGLQQVGREHIGLSSFELVRDAISDGLGWGYVPEPLLGHDESENGKLLTIAHGLNKSWYTYLIFSLESCNHDNSFIGQISSLIQKEIQAL